MNSRPAGGLRLRTPCKEDLCFLTQRRATWLGLLLLLLFFLLLVLLVPILLLPLFIPFLLAVIGRSEQLPCTLLQEGADSQGGGGAGEEVHGGGGAAEEVQRGGGEGRRSSVYYTNRRREGAGLVALRSWYSNAGIIWPEGERDDIITDIIKDIITDIIILVYLKS